MIQGAFRIGAGYFHGMLKMKTVVIPFVASIFLATTLTPCMSVRAQQFRIESQVVVNNSKLPTTENLTLFDNAFVYDFSFVPDGSQTPLEVIVYDIARQKFVLLDINREMRLEVEQFEVVQMLEQLRQRLGDDEKTAWLANPNFVEEVDLDAATVTLTSDNVRYVAKCEKPRNAAMQAALYEFMDQFTMLRATEPRSMPPFARMQLNQAFRKYGLSPTEIDLTMESRGLANKNLKAKSSHSMISQLSTTDRERIEQAKKQWIQFKQVDLPTYRELKAVAEAGEAETKSRR